MYSAPSFFFLNFLKTKFFFEVLKRLLKSTNTQYFTIKLLLRRVCVSACKTENNNPQCRILYEYVFCILYTLMVNELIQELAIATKHKLRVYV